MLEKAVPKIPINVVTELSNIRKGCWEGGEGWRRIPQKLGALKNTGILLLGRLAVDVLLSTQLLYDESIVGCGLTARLTLQEGEIGR